MQPTSKTTLAFALALGFHSATAGTEVAAPESDKAQSGNWCEWLQSKPGTLYKNKENPILQSFQLGGRLHYQAAYVDGGDVNGADFSESYDEFRRVRLESKTEFLQYFSTKVGINIVADDRFRGEDLEWGYDTFDEALLTFDIKKAFGADALDSLKVTYGRHKFNMTEEVHLSSKEMPVIERSAIANKLYGNPNRPTGVTLDGELGKWSATIGLFSGEEDSEFIGGWNDGQAYYFSAAHQTSETLRFVLDFVQNDRSGEDGDDFLKYEWATALNGIYENGRFGAITTLVLGKNNDEDDRDGSFHALVLIPWYWIVEERLQAVVQYQYAGASEAEGVRTNSRYIRNGSTGANVNDGRGDELHTLYAGLNYHLCGHNAKFMGGVEYTSLDTPDGDVDALTYLIAFRTFF